MLKVWYDDQPNSIIERVNKLLKQHGLWFEDDGKEHDGCLIYELKHIREKVYEFDYYDDNDDFK